MLLSVKIEMAWAFEILSSEREVCNHPTWSTPWLLMTWRSKQLGLSHIYGDGGGWNIYCWRDIRLIGHYLCFLYKTSERRMKKKKYGTYNGSGCGHLSCTFGVNTIDVTNYCRLFWQSPKFDTLWKALYSIIYGWLRITLKLWGKSNYTKPWQKHIASYIKNLSGTWKEERRHI